MIRAVIKGSATIASNINRMMLVLGFLLLVLTGCSAVLVDIYQNTTTNIVGGGDMTIERAPWMVVIFRRVFEDPPANTHFSLSRSCAGSIIAPNAILTAQHCVPPAPANVEYFVKTGVTDLNEISIASEMTRVVKIVRYPRYYSASYGKDVAILFLEYDLEITPRQKPIKLCPPKQAKKLEKVGTRGTIFGWGASVEKGPYSNVLRGAVVRIYALNALFSSAGPLTPDQIPVGAVGKKGFTNACDGDDGGSFIVMKRKNIFLLGVASWGSSCAKSTPWIYARVSHFGAWINRILKAEASPSTSTTIPALGRTLIATDNVIQQLVRIPRNLKAVHFSLLGTGNAELSVRFLHKTGPPDCTSGVELRCSFFYPLEGEYQLNIRGLAPYGAYMQLDAVYEILNDGIEVMTVKYPNIKLHKGSVDNWGGLVAVPGQPFSAEIVKRLPTYAASYKLSHVSIGPSVADELPSMCSDSVKCDGTIPRGATAVSLRVDGDPEQDVTYDLEIQTAHVKGNYNFNIMPLVHFVPNQKSAKFVINKLKPGTELGLRVHLLSGSSSLDVSVYFGPNKNLVVQANDKVLVGQTLLLSLIVPYYSTTATIGLIGRDAKYVIVALIEK